MIPDGYTDLAPGKIAAVVTYLEMIERPSVAGASSNGVTLRRVQHPNLDWYRTRYKLAGAQWLWFSRLEMGDAELAVRLTLPTTELFIAERGASEIGIAELDRSQPPNVEIASFALFPDAIGQGLGRSFMAELLAHAWGPLTTRVWLHTCTLDSSGALSFYRKCGFRAYKRGIEVADDPRIGGILPEDAAPQIPIIR